MATYLELKALESDQNLINKVEVAIWSAINTIAGESTGTANHAARVTWAQRAASGTADMARTALRLVLAANSSLTPVQMQAASDAAIQTAVNATIVVLAGITS